jgi:hypothetical protein
MKHLDTKVSGQPSETLDDVSQPHDAEPPAVFDARTPRELFDGLDRELREVDAVIVTHVGWLSEDIRSEVDLLLACRARGGRIQIERRGLKTRSAGTTAAPLYTPNVWLPRRNHDRCH